MDTKVDSNSLAIVLLTAKTTPERGLYAQHTLRTTLDRIRSTFPIHVHIGDDGSEQGHVESLIEIAYGRYPVSISNSGHVGYGANYNLAMKYIHEQVGSRYILPLEDDWELNRPDGFDVDPIIRVLNDDVFDSVRLGYIGYTQKLVCEFVYCNDLHWLLFDPIASHEPHVFSGHPRIETVEYQQRVGPWPEGLKPGETEWFIATQMPEARKRVAWPLSLAGDVKHGPWEHIGTVKSYV